MKKELSVWMMLMAAVFLGSVASTALSGCQRSDSQIGPAPASTSHQGPTLAQHQGEGPETPADAPSSADAPPSADAPAGDAGNPGAAAGEGAASGGEVEVPPATDQAQAEGASPAAGEVAAQLVSADVDSAGSEPAEVIAAGGDWPQWGGTRLRNNTPNVKKMPSSWNVGKFNRTTGQWDASLAKNIKWVSNLGSQTYGNPVIADGKVYVGTNNGAGHLKRYPNEIDLGCLLCFDEQSGALLWQHSSEKLITGRVHDWPLQGICCSPMVEGKRLWFVTSRGEVRCLDTEGFHDGEDDGPVAGEMGRVLDLENSAPNYAAVLAALDAAEVTEELKTQLAAHGHPLQGEVQVEVQTAGKKWVIRGEVDGVQRPLMASQVGPRISFFKQIGPADKLEADTIWVVNMMDQLGVSQHNMCSCSVTALGDLLFVNTSNGLDESHINLPAPDAPSFICMNKNTGEVYWTSKDPGTNILHGQWSSPTVAELGGVPQVLFAGGDGWLYSYRADRGENGAPVMLWKFDCNPKQTKWILGGAGTRNNIIGTPVVYEDLVYIAVGQDPEHGEGEGHLWCINPTKRGDVSPQLAVKLVDGKREPIAHKRIQAVEAELGELAVDNPNSAVVWHYSSFDQNGDGEIDFEEEMHRTIGTVAVKDGLVYVADLSGLIHCLDAKGTADGQPKIHFTYDMLAQSWGSPLIADGKVYFGDEDGDLSIFELGAENSQPIEEINMGSSIYSTPVAANNVLFISTKDKLFAIAQQAGDEDIADDEDAEQDE